MTLMSVNIRKIISMLILHSIRKFVCMWPVFYVAFVHVVLWHSYAVYPQLSVGVLEEFTQLSFLIIGHFYVHLDILERSLGVDDAIWICAKEA